MRAIYATFTYWDLIKEDLFHSNSKTRVSDPFNAATFFVLGLESFYKSILTHSAFIGFKNSFKFEASYLNEHDPNDIT